MSDVRLIDANALLAQIPTIEDEYKYVRKLIDNAPTVEPEITNEDIQNAIKQGYNDGFEMAKAKFERPQGEWINHRTVKHDGEFYCSNCDFELCDFVEGIFYRFCPNCGAKMTDNKDDNQS